ncbi:hypothetical protein GCM10023340_10400 [Nocardioides marinquilinus]|uniref:Zinc ribbon domain-containing protein n=1 Tax=Nocardioides marinquilinus TaxID=1210400 RepID=A0ABP9PGE7_9ACTN
MLLSLPDDAFTPALTPGRLKRAGRRTDGPDMPVLNSQTLTCPLCRDDVPASAASCRSCHLPIQDVRRHHLGGRRRGADLRIRLVGLVAYPALVAWCLWQLPTAATFVVPAAFVGWVLHVVRGRPVVGALVFMVVVALAPLLFWTAMATDLMDDVGSLF